MSSVVLLPASFAVLLAGALLFTNAIEWFGSRLELGQGAVGSLRFSGRAIVLWTLLYGAFVVYVVAG